MFGFLRPSCQSTAYRQAYARCCQYQRHHYGLLALPFLSYEAVLLYLLGIDSGSFPSPDADAPTCCRLRSRVGLGQMNEAPLGEFCASLGLLLAAIKLEDDARDGARPMSSVANWMLRRRFAAAQSYFETLDPQFAVTVQQHIADHLDLERPESEQTIADYSTPTANAFGHVFGLLGVHGLWAAAKWPRAVKSAQAAARRLAGQRNVVWPVAIRRQRCRVAIVDLIYVVVVVIRVSWATQKRSNEKRRAATRNRRRRRN